MSTWTQLGPSIYHRLAFGCAYGLTDAGLVRQSATATASSPCSRATRPCTSGRSKPAWAIGPTAAVLPDVKVCELQDGDLYLLCSDGLYCNMPHAAIQQAMAGAHAQSLDACCAELIDLAKRHGSRDNITAVLALAAR